MEQKKQKTSKGWIVTSVSLMLFSLCLVVAVSFSLMHNSKTMHAVERGYEQKLYDLGDNMSNIEVNLSKLMIAPEGKYATILLTDIYSEALAAEKALSDLPIDWHASENAASFLNQVADFAISYQQAIVSGREGKQFRENVENMYIAARQLGAEVSDSVSLVAQNKLDIRKITADRPFTFRQSEDTVMHNSVEYPELIYDGPFSDGRADETYRCLENAPEISLKEAKEIALAALGEDFRTARVLSAGKSAQEPLYELTVASDRAEAYLSVSQRGGRVVNLSVSRPFGQIMLGEESAKACAKAFAAKLGYEAEPVWYLSSGGAAYVNLAPIVDDVVFYTDLVKVKIALDNGELLGLEAKNYCLNHTERDTKLTMNRAAVPTLLDSNLQVKSVRGALIPLENGKERLCYEAACEYKGLDYFVYLDAADGETVKIMRVVDNDQGSLVM